MVLWRSEVIENYQTNDRKGTITLLSIMLAHRRTTSADRNISSNFIWKLTSYENTFSQSLWIFSLINYQPPTFHNGSYTYPGWAHGLGWSIAAASLICIPTYAIANIIRAEGNTFLEVVLLSSDLPICFCYCNNRLCYRNWGMQRYQTYTNVKFAESIIVNMISPKTKVSKKCRQLYQLFVRKTSFCNRLHLVIKSDLVIKWMQPIMFLQILIQIRIAKMKLKTNKNNENCSSHCVKISFSIDRSKYYYASIKNFICEQICVKVVNNIESSYKN